MLVMASGFSTLVLMRLHNFAICAALNMPNTAMLEHPLNSIIASAHGGSKLILMRAARKAFCAACAITVRHIEINR
jgi:hypothetical protein